MLYPDHSALITAIEPGTAAERAGLKRDDRVISVDGQPLREANELARRIGSMKIGQVVTLEVVRGQQTSKIQVTLAAPIAGAGH